MKESAYKNKTSRANVVSGAGSFAVLRVALIVIEAALNCFCPDPRNQR